MTTVINILDYIDSYMAAEVVPQIQAVTEGEIEVHIHSPGGEVSSAWAIFNELNFKKQAGIPVTTIVTGISASAATFIMLVGQRVKAATNSNILIHNPSTFSYGTADDMATEAAALKKVQDMMVTMYVARTGRKAQDIQSLMDSDKWLTPEEAKANGLVDEVIPDLLEKQTATAFGRSPVLTTPVKMFRAYSAKPTQAFQQPKNTKTMTEEQAAALQAENTQLKTKTTELETKVKELENKQTEQALDAELAQAETEGRITAAQKPTLKAMAAGNIAGLKTYLETLPVQARKQPIASQLKPVAAAGEVALPEALKGKDFHALTKTTEGSEYLQALKAEQPEAYQALYSKSFQAN